ARPELFWPGQEPELQTPSPGDFGPEAPPPTAQFARMRGLAVTEERYLVAGALDPAGLIIFDLHAGGPPLWMDWPSEIPFAPYDMAAGPGGLLYILDREHSRYWVLDRHFQTLDVDQERVEIEPAHAFHFHPEDGPERQPKPARTFPTGIAL